ncbi:MAG: bifunctional phosphopantothenoylcysteine decarboxylase/phosphopantothenate--cysteine ligase CoaBC [Dehalococcoidia bacterium]|nr:MAG: bifunctional phosphopantothenoylcysteine decarboxylase/phosphopantothenate--cysteine ligase CoaBC [Dehalococcoidia bacterium]
MFEDKNVVLGVTGSISAYKAVDIASKLTQRGLAVDVVMTKAAMQFVTPLSFRSITHRPVVTDMWDLSSEFSVEHVALSERADVVVIAPATANTIAKLAVGIADEMLTSTVLATRAPVIVAPAMDAGMYNNAITQENLAKLRSRGFTIVGPAHGRLASGLVGMGRLVETEEILTSILQVLARKGDLAEKQIVVSAGGTREPIDLVRYIGNRSSGKMGFAVAEAARDRGGIVTLISSVTELPPPTGVDVMQVETAQQMRDAVINASGAADVLIMAAAVADYQPAQVAERKIKREAETLTLELVKTADILSEVGGGIIKVGFAAESEDMVERATQKLKSKELDLIAANDVTAEGSGFGADTNRVTLIDSEGKVEELPLMPKYEVANRILDKVVELISAAPD